MKTPAETSPYDALVPDELELPQLPRAPLERADAARNREAILEAAERLLRHEGLSAITMDRLAGEAGVGKGTLFRRFGDRANLFHTLLDESERRLQEGFIRGPAPLGPGAPPAARLIAFGHELLELTRERGQLLLAARPPDPGLYFRSAVYVAYRSHINYLLHELEAADPEYLADVLLAALAPDLVLNQLERMTIEDCKAGWQALIERLASPC